jgi:hypothetical protein
MLILYCNHKDIQKRGIILNFKNQGISNRYHY